VLSLQCDSIIIGVHELYNETWIDWLVVHILGNWVNLSSNLG